MPDNAKRESPFKAPSVEVRNFTDFIEITQEVTHPKTKRVTAYVLMVTSEQARTLAADLLEAAQQYDSPLTDEDVAPYLEGLGSAQASEEQARDDVARLFKRVHDGT